MANSLIHRLVSMFGRNGPYGIYERDMLTWAKTEYGKDWQYAYQYMVANNGKAPKEVKGVYQ